VADNTDCCDSDANAHPGQASYFTSEDACGSFDYNCNGSADAEHLALEVPCTNAGVCSQGGAMCAHGTAGWSGGAVAACGTTATWFLGTCQTGKTTCCSGTCPDGSGCACGGVCGAPNTEQMIQRCH
jgi:hypothetical protein